MDCFDCSARAKLTDGLMVCPCALWHCIRSPYPSPVHWRSRLCAGTGRRSPMTKSLPSTAGLATCNLSCDIIRVATPGSGPRLAMAFYRSCADRDERIRCVAVDLRPYTAATRRAPARRRPRRLPRRRSPLPPRRSARDTPRMLTAVLSPDSALKSTPFPHAFPLSEPKSRKTQRSAPPGGQGYRCRVRAIPWTWVRFVHSPLLLWYGSPASSR